MKHKQSPHFRPLVLCPSCKDESDISHCTIGKEYTWWCRNGDCGKQYRFVIADDWSVESEPTGIVVKKTIVTLELPPQEHSIYLEVEGLKTLDNDDINNDKYFYEEHICPENILRATTSITIDGDDDRHGLFKYIKTEQPG